MKSVAPHEPLPVTIGCILGAQGIALRQHGFTQLAGHVGHVHLSQNPGNPWESGELAWFIMVYHQFLPLKWTSGH